MKKIFSLFLALLLTASMLLQLTACSRNSTDADLKMGQWLSLIADSFGMSGYMDATPYFKNVPASDTYFDAFQMAAEWDILAPNEKTAANTVVTWKDALVTLVNAGEFTDSDLSDDDKVKYGIENFDSSIRDYRVDKPIPEENAIMLLATAQNKWSNKTYDESIERHSYKEGVQDFTNFPDVKVSDDGSDYIVPNMSIDNLPAPSQDFIDGLFDNETTENNSSTVAENDMPSGEIRENNGSTTSKNGTSTGDINENSKGTASKNDTSSGDINENSEGTASENGLSSDESNGDSSSSASSTPAAKPGTSDPTTLKPGDLIVVPAPDNILDKEYRKVKDVEIKDGETIIHTSDEDVGLEDVYQELHIQGTVVPTAENTIIRDPDGNILNPETAEALKLARYDDSKPQYADLVYKPGQSAEIQKCTKNISKDFKIGDDTIKFKATIDKNSVGISATVETGNCLKTNDKSNEDKYGKLNGSVSIGLDNISITQDFDWEFLKLKSAMLRVDAKTSQHIEMAYSKKFNGVVAPDDNRNSSFSSNFKRAVLKSTNGKGAKTIASRKVINIASIDVYNAGVAKVCLDINLQFKVDGSIEVTCTQSNGVGVEYKNGNVRFIKEHSEKAEASAKGNVEINCGIGPALYALGLKKKLLGFEARPGIGIEASATIRLADEENHLLQECNDLNEIATPEEMEDVIKKTSITATHQEIAEIAASQGKVYKSEAEMSRVHADCCLEFEVYFVLSAGLSTSSFLTDMMNLIDIDIKVDLSDNVKVNNSGIEIKVPLFKRHVDNGDWANASDTCRLKYKPFDLGEGESSALPDNGDNSDNGTKEDTSVSHGENLILSTMSANMTVGAENQIKIEQLPNGYSTSDVLFVSQNGKVATVDMTGVIKAVSEGSTIIYAQTKDEKFKAMVAVIVEGDYDTEFNSLIV